MRLDEIRSLSVPKGLKQKERVILSPFDKLRINSVEGSLNTLLRGRSLWQSMEVIL